MVEEVGAFLAAQLPARFTLGTNLFLNYMPDEPATATVVIEYPGSPPLDVYARKPAVEAPRFQLVCRSSGDGSGPTVGRDNADAAFMSLHAVGNQTLSGSTYLSISALQSPFLLDRDARGRVEFACNYECWRCR